MALSDCPKCWETPCACGHEYRNWPRARRIAHAAVMLGVSTEMLVQAVDVPEQHPQAEGVGLNPLVAQLMPGNDTN